MVRRSVRQVREDKQLAYANLVSKNAAAYLKRTEKRLAAYMAAHGYTEKVWHGTGVDDFNVFRLVRRKDGRNGIDGMADSDVKMAFFSYQESTAENYAALAAYDVDTDYEEYADGATPNVRSFYVNPGKVLDLDENKRPMGYKEWTETIRKAHADGYNAIRVKGAIDDQGARLPKNEGDPMMWLNRADMTPEQERLMDEVGAIRTDILVVIDQKNDPGANRIKAADPVTFWDDVHGELPIPMEMRANPSIPDIRFSVGISRDTITDDDLTKPSRDVVLPKLPDKVDEIMGGNSRPVLIKKNIFEKNLASHPELTPDESRKILGLALYNPQLVGRSQPKRREHYWVAVNTGNMNATVVVDVYPHKDNVEVVGWRNVDARGLERLKRQAAREDGQLLMLSPDDGSAAALSALPNGLSQSTGNVPYRANEVNRAKSAIQTARETPEKRHSVFIGIKGADKAKIAQGRLGKALEILDAWEEKHYATKTSAFDPAHDDAFRREVYVKTGWWMGTDGLWRFEIADLKPKTRFGKTVGNGEYYKNGLMFVSGENHSHGYCDIESICRHPTLFKAYPELKEITVKISDPETMPGYSGQYDPERKQIEISSEFTQRRDGDMSNIIDAGGVMVLTHELQHAVQHIEDFNRGGNEAYNGKRNYRLLAGEVEARNAERRMFGVYRDLQSPDADEAMREEYADNYAPWKTEDVPQARQILVGSDGAMRDQSGNFIERRSVRALDTESDARRAITAYAQAEGDKAANDALESIVACLKLSHGSIPRDAGGAAFDPSCNIKGKGLGENVSKC